MAGFYSCLKAPKMGSTMADRPIDRIERPEGEDPGEDFARKKKSRFQSFKNFFAKRKKNREPSSPAGGESKLKPSQSSSELRGPNLDSDVLRSLTEPGSKGGMGNKALSHDSVFVPESLPDVASHACLQENLPGKVKALQLRLQENLRLGSPPLAIPARKAEDGGGFSEDNGLPRSPPEISTLHESSNPVQRHSSLSLGGTDSEDDQVPPEPSSGSPSPVSATALGSPAFPGGPSLPVDFDSPATPLGCLDTSAARHRIAINPRRQKALAGKTQNLPMEHAENGEPLLRTAEGKTSHGKSVEEPDGQRKDWEGTPAQNANISKREWLSSALPVIKASEALRYSWNAGPGTDWEIQALTGMELPADSPEGQPPSAVCEEDVPREGERSKGTNDVVRELRRWPRSTGKEKVRGLASWQAETETTGPFDKSHTTLHGPPSKCPQPSEQKAKDSRAGNNGTDGDQVGGTVADGNSFVPIDANPALMQLPSSSSEGPSEAENAAGSSSENSPEVKEGARGSADMTLRWLEGRPRPVGSPEEELAIQESATSDRLPLRNMAGEKPCLSAEPGCSVSSPSQGPQEALQNLGNLSPRGSAATGSAEAVAQSLPPDDNAGDQLGNVKTEDGSKTPNEVGQTQPKSASTKPVRFTIAPAWQRSLSGGSNSTDGSCPRSTPSSPIRSEMFEGMPPLDSTAESCTLSDPERLERSHKSLVSDLDPATGWPNEDLQGQESPFCVKLRRTSSLLRYQMEQKPPEPPKAFPATVSRTSSVSVKADPKPPGSGALLPDLPGGAQVSLAKSSLQDQKKPLKSKQEEGATRQQTGRPSERLPAAPSGTPPAEPTWVSVAKVKQRRGFPGRPFARGEETEEKPSSTAEPRGQKRTRVAQLDKQASLAGENISKKASSGPGRVLPTTALPKLTIPVTKAPLVRPAVQEAPWVEKETRALPGLPLTSCGPAEPPWLSLAKKKAKAWSEMPQIVQ